jgi:hypothetical protein
MPLFQKIMDREYHPLRADLGEGLEAIRRQLPAARRFTVDDAIAPIVIDLANTSWSKQARDIEFGAAILPASCTWIELISEVQGKGTVRGVEVEVKDAQSFGWMLNSDVSMRKFNGAFVHAIHHNSEKWSMHPYLIRGEFGADRPIMQMALDPERRDVLERHSSHWEAYLWSNISMVAVICCLLASPKVHVIKTNEFGKKHARARLARGKEPVLSWSEISIRLDQRQEARRAEAAATGRQVALHQVRSFWRIRRGKVEYVRAHYRGSAEVGVRLSDFRAIGKPELVLPPKP